MLTENVDWLFLTPHDIQSNKNNTFLSELTAMRGKTLYENGKRPSFQIESGLFCDSDTLDSHCYHIIALFNDRIVGSIRLLPLPSQQPCVSEKIFGKDTVIKITNPLFAQNKSVFEVSRWTVSPDYRSNKLNIHLVAAMWAFVQKFDFDIVISSAGMCARQDQFLLKIGGARLILGHEKPFYSEKMNDYVRLLIYYRDQPPTKILNLIEEMSVHLFGNTNKYFEFSKNLEMNSVSQLI